MRHVNPYITYILSVIPKANQPMELIYAHEITLYIYIPCFPWPVFHCLPLTPLISFSLLVVDRIFEYQMQRRLKRCENPAHWISFEALV
jgi:hypothetical protein